MTIFLLALGGLAVWGVVASILVASRDGYRREPVRPFAETWRTSATIPDARPSDLSAGQWLREPENAIRGARPAAAPAAGVMVLRPW